MQPVKRYDLEALCVAPVESESGGWVRCEDHEAAVAAARSDEAEIREALRVLGGDLDERDGCE